MNLSNNKIFKITFLFLILAELLSIFAWGLSLFNTICFFVILAVTLILSINRLAYGIFILFAELFIGSHGYLFSLNLGETWLSIRLGLFVVIMLAWVIHLFKQGGIKQYYERIKKFVFLKWYIALGVIIIWGLIWGILKGNNFGYVFLDFNNWLYFLILLPVFDVACPKEKLDSKTLTFAGCSFIDNLFQILTASIVWLAIKTVVILYIVSHKFVYIMPEIYQWIRDTRIGEITLMYDNFYRVFFQSHIYSLLFFFVILIILVNKQNQTKNRAVQQSNNVLSKLFRTQQSALYLLLTICLTTTIISFSRSFWIGLVVGFIALLFYYFVTLKKRKTGLKIILNTILIGIASLIIIFIVIKLPPYIQSDYITSLLEKRLTQIGAAGSSRINMLKPLTQAIIQHPVIGAGFGTTLTYISADPRVLQSTAGASGEYTTYAFEWAYLDMLLKLGLIGLVVYLGLIFKIGHKLFQISDFRFQIGNSNSNPPLLKIEQPVSPISSDRSANQDGSNNRTMSLGFLFALISLLAVNIFTPYLNHPLGIGFIVLSSILAHNHQKNNLTNN